MKRSTFYFTAVSCIILWAPHLVSGQATFRSIVLWGEPAPGTGPGISFAGGATPPAINNAGQVAFGALLQGSGVTNSNIAGIWSGTGGGLSLIARMGSLAPGAEIGDTFGSFLFLANNDSGHVVLTASLSGAFGIGIWRTDQGGLSLVARPGMAAPGTEPGVEFELLGAVVEPVLNNVGQTVFGATLVGPGITFNGNGVWLGVPGDLDIVARAGEQAPGEPPGSTFLIFDSALFGLNVLTSQGHTAFSAATSSGTGGIWAGTMDNLSLIVRGFSPAPGAEPALFAALGVPTINCLGQIAFRGMLFGIGVTDENNVGVWSEAEGVLSMVARSGDPAPGTEAGVTFSDFETISIQVNKLGQTVFTGKVTGTNVDQSNDYGYWMEQEGSLRLVTREGDHAPGTPAGVVFDQLGGAVPPGPPWPLSLNNGGQVAFFATLVGPGIDITNDRGIWAEVDGVLELLIRSGSTIEFQPGDQRNVTHVGTFFGGTGNGDGKPSQFSDLGQLVISADMDDANGNFISGLFVANTLGSSGLPANVDGDGDVDIIDFANFQACFSGEGVLANDACQLSFDYDCDGDIDLADLTVFQEALNGPLP